MALAVKDYEQWEPEQGAPAGVAFEIKVSSKSRPDLVYTIARDEQGVIFHAPACERWRFAGKQVGGKDRHLCSHVAEALALAESPEVTFLEQAITRYKAIGGAMATGDDLYRFWTGTMNAVIGAREIRYTQLRVKATKDEMATETLAEKAAAGVEAFDRGDPRERVA